MRSVFSEHLHVSAQNEPQITHRSTRLKYLIYGLLLSPIPNFSLFCSMVCRFPDNYDNISYCPWLQYAISIFWWKANVEIPHTLYVGIGIRNLYKNLITLLKT